MRTFWLFKMRTAQASAQYPDCPAQEAAKSGSRSAGTTVKGAGAGGFG